MDRDHDDATPTGPTDSDKKDADATSPGWDGIDDATELDPLEEDRPGELSETVQGETEIAAPADLKDSKKVDYELFTELADGGIENYRVVRQLGSGGMGAVFLAEQLHPVKRQVALKVIKLGMDTREVVARFESERQALAVMDHPNIARVYDAGATVRGRPYFVMELVEGQPLNHYCDAHSLDVRARLQLFVEVCRGVQHAHQKGVIHRDLKPSNILVTEHDGQAQPKIIDFGVAKATRARQEMLGTMHTTVGQMVGTPTYMSPEQAELSTLDIDTRTDIYSLGVILYEMLTGQLPLDRDMLRVGSLGELQRVIQEKEPATPSARLTTLGGRRAEIARLRQTDPGALRRQLRGDLDWIVMKALEKDRARRYETANGLALDVLRHLADETVEARPRSKTYAAMKFVKRHRFAVTGAAAVTVALVGGVVGTSIGFLRAQQETQRASAVSRFLKDMLRTVDPHSAKGHEVTMREVLDQAAQKADESFAGTPRIEAEIRGTIGEMYMQIGLYVEAMPHVRRAVELFEQTVGPDSDFTLRAVNLLGVTLWESGNRVEAEEVWRGLVQRYTRAKGADGVGTMTIKQNLAARLLQSGDLDRAEPLLLEVLEGRRRVLGPEHAATTASMNNLAYAYTKRGRLQEAEALFVETLEIRTRTQGEDSPRTLSSKQSLGDLYRMTGRYEQAEPLLRQAYEGLREVRGEEHSHTLAAMRALAATLAASEQYSEAEPLAIECYRQYLQLGGSDDEPLHELASTLVTIFEATGRPALADEWRARAEADPSSTTESEAR